MYDAVVMGVPDDEWGQIVAAVVATTGAAPPDADALDDVGRRAARGLQAAAAHRVRRRGGTHHRRQARLRLGARRAARRLTRAHQARCSRTSAAARSESSCTKKWVPDTVTRSTPARSACAANMPSGRSVPSAQTIVDVRGERRQVVERRGRAVGPGAALEEPRLHLGRAGQLDLTVGPVAEAPTHVAVEGGGLHHVERRPAAVRLPDRRPVGPHRPAAARHRRHVVLALGPRQAAHQPHGDRLAQQQPAYQPRSQPVDQDAGAAPQRLAQQHDLLEAERVERGDHVARRRRRTRSPRRWRVRRWCRGPAGRCRSGGTRRAAAGPAGRTPRRRSRWGGAARAAGRRHPSRGRRS